MTLIKTKGARQLLAALLVLLVGTLLLKTLPAWRLDLTEESLYSLSDGSQNIVSAIDQPLELELFFSVSAAENLPQLLDYGQQVSDLLAEYVALNTSQLTLKVTDPEPFSEDEDRATAAGLTGAPVSMGGDSFYLGLVVTRGDGEQQVIPFFNPDRERFLEYDISQLLYRISQSNQPVVGVLTATQALGGYDFRTRGATPAWMALEQLKGFAKVEAVNIDQGVIQQDLDVLLVIHPQQLGDEDLYAIDQFVLKGGKAMVFVDPSAEVAAQGPGMPNASNLEQLFKVWGVSYNADEVAADRSWALRVPTATNQMPIPHVGIIGLQPEGFDQESLITSELEVINVSSAGHLAAAEGAATEFVPLLQTSASSKIFESAEYALTRDHGNLLVDFVDSGKALTIAARIRGEVASAFPQKPKFDQPETADAAEDADASESAEAETTETEVTPEVAHELKSSGPINVLIVADVDLLSDRLWVQVSNFMGQPMAMPWASNGDFVANAVEQMSGSEDLIGLRSRGQYSRRFTVVNDLRVEAAEQFKQQEQRLTDRLAELEQEIASLNPEANAQNELVLSPEQKKAIEAFEDERLQVRKELRQVQHQLNSSIDELETRLKLINIFLVPLLLLGWMLVMPKLRRRRT
ncbi:Gldg family protein [Candidatus Pelagadaptatus aseana]|uniref:GldG family protein n=1 Tax=Candidatus Pelagadaptatus aseana TaxID=3120508 RepID=UPI003C6EC924